MTDLGDPLDGPMPEPVPPLAPDTEPVLSRALIIGFLAGVLTLALNVVNRHFEFFTLEELNTATALVPTAALIVAALLIRDKVVPVDKVLANRDFDLALGVAVGQQGQQQAVDDALEQVAVLQARNYSLARDAADAAKKAAPRKRTTRKAT